VGCSQGSSGCCNKQHHILRNSLYSRHTDSSLHLHKRPLHKRSNLTQTAGATLAGHPQATQASQTLLHSLYTIQNLQTNKHSITQLL
jgi:hypothetical protein